jgi:tetratricopeptide (TPR) repeat protein
MKSIYIKQAFFAVILLLSTSLVYADRNDDDFVKANAKYSEGAWEEALEYYGNIEKRGFESFELFYNKGNVYYKLERLPEAILYYEKAKRLHPKNEDVEHNLSLCYSLIKDKHQEIPEVFFERWWNNVSDSLSADGWAKLSLVTFILMLVFAGIYLIADKYSLRKFSFWFAIALLVVNLHTFGFAYQEYKQYNNHNFGIIFSPSVTIKSSPDQNSTDIFVLHEGTKVKIMEELPEWKKIKIPDGTTGWIRKDKLEII